MDFFLTTAINYTNGKPHIGHAYEIILADVFCRIKKMSGYDVFLLTGADEHGQKIELKAKAMGINEIDVCNIYVEEFQKLNHMLDIQANRYIRTTSVEHINFVCRFWNMLLEKGDLYLDHYSGWFNVRECKYVTDLEAQLNNYCDPETNIPLERVSEPAYFFRLSKYATRIKDHIAENSNFIKPANMRNEILSRLNDELKDISVTRTGVKWGIKVPNNEQYVMYVWFDALLNYLSGANNGIWPPKLQIIGKDILWFHAVIWSAMLMAGGFDLPNTIYAHGHIIAEGRQKMSKSIGNIVCPFDLLENHDPDAIRFYLCKNSRIGNDIQFSIDDMKCAWNSDLANTLGNYASRVANVVNMFSKMNHDSSLKFSVNLDVIDITRIPRNFGYDLNEYCGILYKLIVQLDRYLSAKKPWRLFSANITVTHPNKMANQSSCYVGVSEKEYMDACDALKTCVEGLYIAGILYEPLIPFAIKRLFHNFGFVVKPLNSLTNDNIDLIHINIIDYKHILFKKYITNIKN